MSHPSGAGRGSNAQGVGGVPASMVPPPNNQQVQIANNQAWLVRQSLLGSGGIPKARNAGDIVGRGMARVFEMAEMYCIGHLANAPKAGHAPKTQTPKWSDLGERQNPMRRHKATDPVWVKNWILHEVNGSQRTAEQMLNEYNLRVFLLTRVIIKYLTREVLKEDCFEPLANLQPQWQLPAAANIHARVQQLQAAQPPPPAQIHTHRLEISNNMRALRRLSPTSPPNMYKTVHQMSQVPWFVTPDPPILGAPEGIAKARGDELWEFVVSFMPRKISCDWTDLLELMEKSHYLVFEMYDQTFEYQFQWLDDNNALFNPDTMVVRQNTLDRYSNADGFDSEKLRGRPVQFSFSPIVLQRQHLPFGQRTDPQVIVRAQVMLGETALTTSSTTIQGKGSGSIGGGKPGWDEGGKFGAIGEGRPSGKGGSGGGGGRRGGASRR
jgi:hypothetical protein